MITGGASGIGKAIADRLRAKGNKVVIVDLRNADVLADLSTDEGRESAACEVEARFPDGLDSLICCAGIGNQPDSGALTTSINYFGTTRFLTRLRPLLAKGNLPRAVVTSSIMSVHPHDPELLRLMLADDEAGARSRTNDTMISYITGKRALCHWVRRNSVSPQWGGSGILLNGIGPGVIVTPLTSANDGPDSDKARSGYCPIVVPEYPGPESIAPIYDYLSGPENTYVVGQIIYADGGSDVLLRGEAIP